MSLVVSLLICAGAIVLCLRTQKQRALRSKVGWIRTPAQCTFETSNPAESQLFFESLDNALSWQSIHSYAGGTSEWGTLSDNVNRLPKEFREYVKHVAVSMCRQVSTNISRDSWSWTTPEGKEVAYVVDAGSGKNYKRKYKHGECHEALQNFDGLEQVQTFLSQKGEAGRLYLQAFSEAGKVCADCEQHKYRYLFYDCQAIHPPEI